MLGPGQASSHPFSRPLPQGYFPILQSFPRGLIATKEQSATHIAVENRGNRTGTYMVVFMKQETARGMLALRQAYDAFRGKK